MKKILFPMASQINNTLTNYTERAPLEEGLG